MTNPSNMTADDISGTRTSTRWRVQPGRIDALNTRWIWPGACEFGIPALKPCSFEPTSLEAWHDPRSRRRAAKNGGAIHFFLDDYRFERVWAHPETALDRVLEVGAALTPDFSLWPEMPLVAQIWQVYRSRWCGAYWQHHGVQVIPTAQWSTEESYDFAFDGLPRHSTIAVSSVGVMQNKQSQQRYRAGLLELVTRCEPTLLVSYGPMPPNCADLPLPPVREFPTFWSHRRGR
jgi:hypothetical protein